MPPFHLCRGSSSACNPPPLDPPLDPSHQELAQQLLQPNPPRLAVSRAITLLESHRGDALLLYLHRHATPVSHLRIGLAGPPGAGKSTLLEALGNYMLQQNITNRLAVLAIDPSSTISGGSILGDATRMPKLAQDERCLIRPSPTGGMLGGLAPETYSLSQLLPMVGYSYIFVETVGLGQSEVDIRETVDIVVVLVPPGGGDSLQGVKRGIMEVADLVVVTKADGDLQPTAEQTSNEYTHAMQFWRRQGPWKPQVLVTSAKTGRGIPDLVRTIQQYPQTMGNHLEERRNRQARYWAGKHVIRLVQDRFKDRPIDDDTIRRWTPHLAAKQWMKEVFGEEYK